MIDTRFAEYFEPWPTHLPEQALATRARGEIRSQGWLIQYLFGELLR